MCYRVRVGVCVSVLRANDTTINLGVWILPALSLGGAVSAPVAPLPWRSKVSHSLV